MEDPEFPTFWGTHVKPGPKPTAFVPPGEVEARLHLSTACLTPGVKDGVRVYVKCKVQDGTPMVIAVLKAGGNEMAALDLVYDQYTEFSVEGSATVHLTGYYMPKESEEGGDEEEDYWRQQQAGMDDDSDDEEYSPEEAAAIREMLLKQTGGRQGGAGLQDNEDSEGEDDDSDDDDVPLAIPLDGLEEDESEDEEGSEYESVSDEEMGVRTAAASSVVIEEIETEDAAEAATKKRKADSAALERPSAAKKAATPAAKQPTAAASAAKAADKTPGKATDKTPAAKKAAASAAKETLAAAKKAAAAAAVQKTPAAKSAATKAQSPAEALLDGTSSPGPRGKGVRTFPNGLKIENIAMGAPDGKLAKAGKRVKMRYCGKLTSGKVFDQTKGGATFSFRLGVGEVIKGWDKGVEGMRVGDKRKITCPPSMAYGNAGAPPSIPPKATLVFDVELVNVM